LPPNIKIAQSLFATYPRSLHGFLQSHSPIIIANASKLTFWRGYDLYGFDMCIQLIAKLQKDFPRAGLVLALAQQGDQAYFKKIFKKINNDPSIYLLYRCRQELWPLFTQADVFVRPTVSDAGPSISAQEALHVGTPVVASDVCDRSKDALLFKNRDGDDFYQKVIVTLKN